MSLEENRQYERAWRDSPEGELFKSEVRNYEFPVQPDGTFWMHEVGPGTYRLRFERTSPCPEAKERSRCCCRDSSEHSRNLLRSEG